MTKIARIDTFTKANRFVPRGGVLYEDEIDTDGNTDNVIEADDVTEERAVVQVSAIAPTGPNPVNPQQIPPDAEQTTEGYVQLGARLVGEVTVPEKQRIEVVGIDPEDDTQGKVQEALDEAEREGRNPNAAGNRGNDDDDLVSGTVDDVTGRISADTSEAELRRLRAAEEDRERPRRGVLSAIDAELDRRSNA